MSGANAISGIVILGAIILIRSTDPENYFTLILASIALFIGSINVSEGGDLNVGEITASAILMDPVNIRSADGLVIGGAGDTFTTSGPANKFTVSDAGGLSMSGSLSVHSSQINFTNLPTSDPGVAGRLYNSGGVVKISL